MLEKILSELSIETIKHENGQFLCICPDCGTKHLYINRSSGLWDCKKGCDRGNLFELVRKIKGLPDRQCFEFLEKYGYKETMAPKASPKTNDISWFRDQLKSANEGDIQKLCEIKQVSGKALINFEPLIHKQEPIVCIPTYTPSCGSICGYLRVGNQGQPVTLKNRKQEKYPAIGGHGLYGVHWLKRENPDTIIFCEAWRDALAAIEAGFYATASSGGASTFKDQWLDLFKNKNVYIVMDADNAGVMAAKRAAKKIYPLAKSVSIVSLPYEITESHGKDLHDYLKLDKGDMSELITGAVEYEPDIDVSDAIILKNDQPDHIAEMIQQYSRSKFDTVLKFNSADGWSRYKNNRYQRIENEKEIDVFVRRCIRKSVIKVKEKQEDGSYKIRYKPLKRKTKGFVNDIKGFLEACDDVYIKPKSMAPASLDGSLNPNNIIALQNGLLDFSVYPYKIYNHSENFYTFNYLDYKWEGEKDSKVWIEFLLDITCGDEELFILLQQWAGYLLKRSCQQQKFLLCYGDGANGKSVFFDVMMALLGPENCSTVPLSKFDDIHHLTQTYGKLANITDESSKGLDEEAETALKQYTGGTQVTFKRLYQQPFSAYPTAKIMIATNKLPRFADTSNGIWRRVLLVPFNAVIPEDKQDKRLAEKIKSFEMSGVLKWALEGIRSLEQMTRFIEPKSSIQALKQYKRDVNPLVIFLEDNFEQSNCDLDKIQTRQLRSWYEQWCNDHGYKAKNDTNVGIQIKKLWPHVEKKRMRQGMDRSMYYTGLKLKNDSELNDVL